MPHRYVAAQNHVSSRLAGEAVILNMDSGVYYGLDAVGARVWELLQAPQTLADLRAAVCAEYQVSPAQCEADLSALLSDLAAHGLVQVTE